LFFKLGRVNIRKNIRGKHKLLNAVELFAGAGGLGMGVSLAGFKATDIVEWDDNCFSTLQFNRSRLVRPVSHWPITHCDVRDVNFTRHEGKVHLVSGGPPCQPFSLAGKHRAHGDARDMFPQAIRAVREIKPEAFIFENVKGLTRLAFSNYLEYIKLQMKHPELILKSNETWDEHLARLEAYETRGKFRGLNYNVVVHLANAADFGIPQKRERVFFIGFRNDLDVSWSFPSVTHSSNSLAWSQYRDSEYWDRHSIHWKNRVFSDRMRNQAWKCIEKPTSLPWVTVRDAISDLPDPQFHPKLASKFTNHRFQDGARSYAGHTGSHIDEPAKTLKAGVHGVPGGENMLLQSDGSVRYFTIRESARLQTFPDDFHFNGSWSESMRQLGNAVPVRLAEIVARDVFRVLRERNATKNLQSPRKTQSRAKH
jgi:DNA (cytosine-5)-methyltransferase 1